MLISVFTDIGAGSLLAGLNGSGDVSGKLGAGEKLVYERGEDLLAGDAGQAESVGCFSLPDIEGTMLGRGEVDGATDAFLPDHRPVCGSGFSGLYGGVWCRRGVGSWVWCGRRRRW